MQVSPSNKAGICNVEGLPGIKSPLYFQIVLVMQRGQ